jgi:hypothetical protein
MYMAIIISIVNVFVLLKLDVSETGAVSDIRKKSGGKVSA